VHTGKSQNNVSRGPESTELGLKQPIGMFERFRRPDRIDQPQHARLCNCHRTIAQHLRVLGRIDWVRGLGLREKKSDERRNRSHLRAGIAGSTLGFWLRAAGFESTLIEHASELRTGGYVIDFWELGYDIAERMDLVSRPSVLHPRQRSPGPRRRPAR
jgi:hypothetical protein